MSYILEALKKLEQKRQQEGTPNLLTLQGEITPVHKKKVRWLKFISGFVIVSIVIVVFLFWVRTKERTPQSMPTQTQMTSDVKMPSQSTVSQTKKEDTITEILKDVPPPEKKDLARSTPSQPLTPTPMKATPEHVSPKTLPAQPSPASKTPDELPLKATKQTQPSKKIVAIKELPPDIKNKLPELKMTVHSYNDQSQSRFVVINNTTVREGQSINNELKLEQITQNGVVLNYQGNRFSLGINESP